MPAILMTYLFKTPIRFLQARDKKTTGYLTAARVLCGGIGSNDLCLGITQPRAEEPGASSTDKHRSVDIGFFSLKLRLFSSAPNFVRELVWLKARLLIHLLQQAEPEIELPTRGGNHCGLQIQSFPCKFENSNCWVRELLTRGTHESMAVPGLSWRQACFGSDDRD